MQKEYEVSYRKTMIVEAETESEARAKAEQVLQQVDYYDFSKQDIIAVKEC